MPHRRVQVSVCNIFHISARRHGAAHRGRDYLDMTKAMRTLWGPTLRAALTHAHEQDAEGQMRSRRIWACRSQLSGGERRSRGIPSGGGRRARGPRHHDVICGARQEPMPQQRPLQSKRVNDTVIVHASVRECPETWLPLTEGEPVTAEALETILVRAMARPRSKLSSPAKPRSKRNISQRPAGPSATRKQSLVCLMETEEWEKHVPSCY